MTDVQKKSSAGALVVDLLGDFTRVGGRALWLKSLVSYGEDLGIPGPTMRVTLARLRERGWFEVTREGRESLYRISSAGLRAIREGALRFRGAEAEPWSGEWSMVIYTVPESDRQVRDELRKQLVWHGFGSLAPATWIRARSGNDDIFTATASLSTAKLTVMTTRTDGIAADRALVERCWDLHDLGAAYDAYVRELRMSMPEMHEAALEATSALVARVNLVHTFRRLVWRDPQIPVELQPPGWQGAEARRLFEQAHGVLAERAAEYYGL